MLALSVLSRFHIAYASLEREVLQNLQIQLGDQHHLALTRARVLLFKEATSQVGII